jgi:hypothetical protein
LEDGVDEAEDGSVGADTKSEAEHRNRGEPGAFAKSAESEAQVV